MSTSARKPTSKSDPQSAPRARGEWETSQAEIRVGYAPVGRETLDAITAEMLGETPSEQGDEPGPEIELSEEPATEESLSTFGSERRAIRAPQITLPYSDRISNAPGARSPSSVPRTATDSPEISVREAPAGRETLAAIEQELIAVARAERPEPVPDPPEPHSEVKPVSEDTAGVEIFEMITFVIRGQDAAKLSTDALRRRFAEEHLMKRLPIESSDAIDRVDVTPWTVRDTFVVRVWCRVSD